MSTPCLPHEDPEAAQRESSLLAKREQYVYDPGVLPPFVLHHTLPDAEDSGGGLFAGFSSAVGMSVNVVAVKLAGLLDPFDELQDFEDLFKTFETPAVVKHWRTDAMFAEQRVAGVECRVLRAAPGLPQTLPVNFQISADEFAAAAGMSLEHAAAEGRLFIADYAMLDGIATGATGSRPKFLYAPIALFCWLDEPGSLDMSHDTPRRGRLAPVVIQLDQRRSAGNLYTAADQPGWCMAKIAVQAADYTWNLLGHHLAICQFGMEAFAMATARQLAEVHPLAVLLRPHLRHVLAQNQQLRRHFLNPGGYIERLFAPTREGAREVMARSFERWDFKTWALPRDLEARGVSDPERLPHYPYRDDGLLLWEAIAQFVGEYLALFYTTDADLLADPELHAWFTELTDPARGNVPGLPAWPLSCAALGEIVTTILFTSGPDHSALNYRQWEYATHIPNLPMALHGAVPPCMPGRAHERGASGDRAMLDLLPPRGQALAQIEVVQRMTAEQPDRFGLYGADSDPLLFASDRIQEVVTAFQERLACIEGEVLERNTRRSFPYLGMLPSRLANSASV